MAVLVFITHFELEFVSLSTALAGDDANQGDAEVASTQRYHPRTLSRLLWCEGERIKSLFYMKMTGLLF